MCDNRGIILRGRIYTIQQEENTGHNRGSNAGGQICEVGFPRPEEGSNKVRSLEDLEQDRIWPMMWVRTSRSGLSHESCRSDRAHCYVVLAAEDRVGYDSFKKLFRKGQHHLLDRVFLAFPSFSSASLLTLTLFWSHFSPMMHFYWASFTKGLATKAEKSYSAALASTSRTLK